MTRILITGGMGFIGRHLLKHLIKDKDNIITVFDNMFRAKNLPTHELREKNPIVVEVGDIRNYKRTLEVIRGSDIVYHLAAFSSVGDSHTIIDYCASTNITGTYNVLRASKECKVKNVIFTSSREVYGDPDDIPVHELHKLHPKNVYGETKRAAEELCMMSEIPVSILRLSNVYGCGDVGRVIPIFIKNARENKPIVIYGGKQIIDFVWIDDVIEALVRAQDYPAIPINVGSGIGTHIIDLAERIRATMGSTSEIIIEKANPVEVVAFIANINRMETLLRVHPRKSMITGLMEIIKEMERNSELI